MHCGLHPAGRTPCVYGSSCVYEALGGGESSRDAHPAIRFDGTGGASDPEKVMAPSASIPSRVKSTSRWNTLKAKVVDLGAGLAQH